MAMLILGSVAGSIVTGYFTSSLNKRILANTAQGDLVRDAMQAEKIKLGEAATVLATLERSIHSSVKLIGENSEIRGFLDTDLGLRAAKRFYVCTETAIPADIANILEPVSLGENGCGIDTETAE